MMLPFGISAYSETYGIVTSSNNKHSESLDTLSKTSKDTFGSLQRYFQSTTTDHLTLEPDRLIDTTSSYTFSLFKLLYNKTITKRMQNMNSDGIFSNPLVVEGKSQLHLYRDFLALSICSTTKKKDGTFFYVLTSDMSRKVNFLELIRDFLHYRDYMNVICIIIKRRRHFLCLRVDMVGAWIHHHRSDVIPPVKIVCVGLDIPSSTTSKEEELYPERVCGSTLTTIASRKAHRTLSTIIKTLDLDSVALITKKRKEKVLILVE